MEQAREQAREQEQAAGKSSNKAASGWIAHRGKSFMLDCMQHINYKAVVWCNRQVEAWAYGMLGNCAGWYPCIGGRTVVPKMQGVLVLPSIVGHWTVCHLSLELLMTYGSRVLKWLQLLSNTYLFSTAGDK